MSTLAAVKWSNQSFAGFWFLSNFLREEGVKEEACRVIVDDLTKQYDIYCTFIKKTFGPTFHIGMDGESGLIRMCMPSTGDEIGHAHISFNEGVENAYIVPF
jgi:hypothetical protein